MDSKTITVTEASRNFSELVSRIHFQGGSAVLLKGGKAMVKMMPVRRPLTGADLALLWPAFPRLDPRDAANFEHELARSRRELPPLVSKWG